MRRVLLAVAAMAIVLGAAGIAGAATSVVPDIPTASTGGSSYAVRPHTIVVSSADGGQLTLHWTQWTSTRALGSGTARPDHGSYTIKLALTDPRYGTFQRLTTTFYLHGKVSGTDRMRLAQTTGSLVLWADPAALGGNSGLVTDEPAGHGGRCTADTVDGVSGVHGLTIEAACSLAIGDASAGGVGCGSPGSSPVRTDIVKTPSYLGYRVTAAGSGSILFMRASTYFTFLQQCM